MNKTTQPMKDRAQIERLFNYLLAKNYRDYMIAKTQLNTARRISDIVNLRVSDFRTIDGQFKSHVRFVEKKTGKIADIALNKPLQKALTLYITEMHLTFDSFLFQSRKGINKPLTTTQVHRIFQTAGKDLGLPDFNTHSLRKTWGYFCYKETKNIALIMTIFNHTCEKVTLRYIGITQAEIDTSCMAIRF